MPPPESAFGQESGTTLIASNQSSGMVLVTIDQGLVEACIPEMASCSFLILTVSSVGPFQSLPHTAASKGPCKPQVPPQSH